MSTYASILVLPHFNFDWQLSFLLEPKVLNPNLAKQIISEMSLNFLSGYSSFHREHFVYASFRLVTPEEPYHLKAYFKIQMGRPIKSWSW